MREAKLTAYLTRVAQPTCKRQSSWSSSCLLIPKTMLPPKSEHTAVSCFRRLAELSLHSLFARGKSCSYSSRLFCQPERAASGILRRPGSGKGSLPSKKPTIAKLWALSGSPYIPAKCPKQDTFLTGWREEFLAFFSCCPPRSS